MTAAAILHDLIGAGVEFETDGERIRWRNAGGRVTSDVVEVLRTHKAEAIDYLMGTPAISHGHDKPPLSPRIAAAVRAAFEDYAATDDPFDARAWA
ncbi:hypothetical protein [Paracoccus ravus]|uniref:hypothetical protein n=1 Tax=Paracoccus ravus TaxID=2447760 RepID=UPI00106DF21D|nr:hypothetical protein [Paracoccus ravus]